MEDSIVDNSSIRVSLVAFVTNGTRRRIVGCVGMLSLFLSQQHRVEAFSIPAHFSVHGTTELRTEQQQLTTITQTKMSSMNPTSKNGYDTMSASRNSLTKLPFLHSSDSGNVPSSCRTLLSAHRTSSSIGNDNDTDSVNNRRPRSARQRKVTTLPNARQKQSKKVITITNVVESSSSSSDIEANSKSIRSSSTNVNSFLSPKSDNRKAKIKGGNANFMSETSMMSHEILTMDEEQRLGKAVQRANALQKLLDEVVMEKEAYLTSRMHIAEIQKVNDFIDIDVDDDDDDDEEEVDSFQNTKGNLKDAKSDRNIFEMFYVGSSPVPFDSTFVPNHERSILKRFDSKSRMAQVRLRQQQLALGNDEQFELNEIENDDIYTSLLETQPKSNSKGTYYVEDFCEDDLDENVRKLTDEEVIERFGLLGGRSELQLLLLDGAMARDKLISSNLKLVNSIAKKWAKMMAKSVTSSSDVSLHAIYSGSWDRPSLSEAIQEGTLGLAKAAERFNPKRGLRFSTYATFWITNSVRQCFQKASTSIRVPVNYYEAKSRFKAHVKRYHERHGIVPTIEVIAKDMNISLKRLKTVLKLTQPVVSIDAPLLQNGYSSQAGKAGGGTGEQSGSALLLSDTLVFVENEFANEAITTINNRITDEHTVYRSIELSFLRKCLEDAMDAELAPHERDVLRLRLGLDDGLSRTCKEVSQYVGGALTTAEVRSTEQRAFKKLRSPEILATYKLLTYLDFADVDEESIRMR